MEIESDNSPKLSVQATLSIKKEPQKVYTGLVCTNSSKSVSNQTSSDLLQKVIKFYQLSSEQRQSLQVFQEQYKSHLTKSQIFPTQKSKIKQLIKQFKSCKQQHQVQIILKLLQLKHLSDFKTKIAFNLYQKIIQYFIYEAFQTNYTQKHFLVEQILNFQNQIGLYLSLFKGLSKNRSKQTQNPINLQKYCNDLFTFLLMNFNQKIKCSCPQQSSFEIQIEKLDAMSQHQLLALEKLMFINNVEQFIQFDETSYTKILEQLTVCIQNERIQQKPNEKLLALYLKTIGILLESYFLLNLKNKQNPQAFIDSILTQSKFYDILQNLFTFNHSLLQTITLIHKILNQNDCIESKTTFDQKQSFNKLIWTIIQNIRFQPSIQFMEKLADFFNLFNNNMKNSGGNINMNMSHAKQRQSTIISQQIFIKLCTLLQIELYQIRQSQHSQLKLRPQTEKSVLNSFFDILSSQSISQMFQTFKKCLQKQPNSQKFQQIFCFFLVNNTIKKQVLLKKQHIISLQVYLFRVLNTLAHNETLNIQFLNLKVLVEYFQFIYLEDQKPFKEKGVMFIAVEYPELLKNEIFQNCDEKNLRQQCFGLMIEAKPHVQRIQIIVHYLRRLEKKLKSGFIQFLFSRNIDVCSFAQFQSITWNLIQSNVPIPSQKFDYIYQNFLIKNPQKFVECLTQKTPTANQICNFNPYKNLFNIYFQNSLLDPLKNQQNHRLLINHIMIQYLKLNIKNLIQSFLSSDKDYPIRLFCYLMKYFIRCIYENIQIQQLFFVITEAIFIFLKNIYKIGFASTVNMSELQQMIEEWKKIVNFYQKRKNSKKLLFTLFAAQLFYFQIFNYNNQAKSTFFFQQLQKLFQNLQTKYKNFILTSLSQWFQQNTSNNTNVTKENKKIQIKNQIQTITNEVTQKIIVSSSLSFIQNACLSQDQQNIDNLWDVLNTSFQNMILKDQKLFNTIPKVSLSQGDFNIFTLKRDKQNYSSDQQNYENTKEKGKNMSQKSSRRSPKNIINAACLQVLIKETLFAELKDEFQTFKQVQSRIQKTCRLSTHFEKSLVLANIVKVQKKLRNISHIKKY